MNGLTLLIGAVVFYLVAYFLYGGFLGRLFGLDPDRPTPAHTLRDDIDYAPTNPFVLFGHHFASIAGAGPIVGPIMAIYFGWGPVALWLLFGCVFIGAMHDLAAMVLSIRNQGRSIASVIEQYVGYAGRQLFLVFCWSTLILVVAVFAKLVAEGFVNNPAVASSSILFISIAPIFGWLVYRRGLSILVGSLIFVPLVFFFVWLGTKIPLDLGVILGSTESRAKTIWILILMVYCTAASTLPVWLMLQPRDYLNSYLLYGMLLFGFVGIIACRPDIQMPAFEGLTARNFSNVETSLFPFVFVTIACGACSGFHSLVASGTTAKQLNNEKDAIPAGYGAMLLEGILGVIAMISVAYLSRDEIIAKGGVKDASTLFATGLATFGSRLGVSETIGTAFVSLSVSAFLMTSLDTSTRLARFTLQELFSPRAGVVGTPTQNSPSLRNPVAAFFSNMYVATLLSVFFALWLTFGESDRIWPVFGASNQLLAALTLLVASLWLIRRRAKPLVAIIPMVIMISVSCTALFQLAGSELRRDGNIPQVAGGQQSKDANISQVIVSEQIKDGNITPQLAGDEQGKDGIIPQIVGGEQIKEGNSPQSAASEQNGDGNVALGLICVILLALALVLVLMSARAVACEFRKGRSAA